MMKIIKLFVLFLFLSTCVYSQAIWKDKNGILSPKDARNVGVASLQNFSVGDTNIIRMRSGVVQFLGGGSWYAIPIPTSYVAYADSTVKYVTPNSFLSLFDTRLGTKTTTNLAEGINLYYTDARARAAISETITGIDYSSGVFSLAATYFIPRDSMAGVWNDKYTQVQVNGFVGAKLDTMLATTLLRSQWNLGYADRLKWDGGSSGLVAATGRTSLGLGSIALKDTSYYYRSSNPSNFIALTALSSIATGLTYTNTTGVFSLTSGYVVPTTTEETNWNLAYTRSTLMVADTTNWNTAYSHTLLTNNPHSVTAVQVGLGNVTNESKATMFTNPIFTGTVTIPTPFTLGAVSVTTTPQQFNYLNGATGTTGATTSNLVFSASPSLTGKTTVDSLLVNNLTSGYLPYYGGTRLKNSGIYYDPITSSIGIGTTPGAKLDVLGTMRSQSAGGRTLSLSSVDSGVTWQIWAASGSTGDEFRYGSGSDIPLTFYTNNAEVMRIRNGSIGIGTVTVLSKTGIAGNLAVGATYGALAAPTSGLIIEGRTLIGTSTDNTVDLLQVNGSVSFGKITTSGAFKGSSSTRGTDSFTTTATADTVVVSGATVSDVYMITYTTAVTAAEAPPSVVSTATGFIVTRPAGTTSGATYAWMRQE